MEAQQPGNAIQALNYLLEQWAVMSSTHTATAPDTLFHLWHDLAHVLCRGDAQRAQAFVQEINSSRQNGQTCRPPVQTMEQLLLELENTGVRSLFLAVSIRHVVDQLIALNQPTQLEAWKTLADGILPMQALLGRTRDEMPAESSTYGPQT